jgi:hypothetical protein
MKSRPAMKSALAPAYRRSQVLGLLMVAAVLLAVILARADMRILFPPGWWRF